jgi:hypothetical protein
MQFVNATRLRRLNNAISLTASFRSPFTASWMPVEMYLRVNSIQLREACFFFVPLLSLCPFKKDNEGVVFRSSFALGRIQLVSPSDAPAT